MEYLQIILLHLMKNWKNINSNYRTDKNDESSHEEALVIFLTRKGLIKN